MLAREEKEKAFGGRSEYGQVHAVLTGSSHSRNTENKNFRKERNPASETGDQNDKTIEIYGLGSA